jgi:hypothetical protein
VLTFGSHSQLGDGFVILIERGTGELLPDDDRRRDLLE